MSPFFREKVQDLPAVQKCLKIQKESERMRKTFADAQGKVADVHRMRDESVQQWTVNPGSADVEKTLAAIALGHAATEFRSLLCTREQIAIDILQKDPSVTDTLEKALAEVIAVVESAHDRLQADERASANKAGLAYGGHSPTLRSLDTLKAEYVDALHAVENLRDSSDSNLFGRFIQLLTP